MSKLLFQEPVFMRKTDLIEEISGLDDALELLKSWPHDGRDLAYETMHGACVRAKHGHFPLTAVRENFRKFLKRVEMLVEDEAGALSPA